MKKYLSIYVMLLFISACKDNTTKEVLKLDVSINGKVNANKLEYLKGQEKGQYYSVNLNLFNSADSLMDIVTMSCTWQDNCIFNDSRVFLLYDSICRNNFPNLTTIQANKTKIFKGVMWVNDSLVASNKNLKLGFIVIKKQEVSYSVEFKDILKNKIKSKQDIIWSNPIEFK